MHSYAGKRRNALLQLLDPQLGTEEQVDQLAAYLESEVRRAYGRGWHDAKRGGREPGARRPGQYPSALENGKLHPVERNREGA